MRKKVRPKKSKRLANDDTEWLLAPVNTPANIALADLYPGGNVVKMTVFNETSRKRELRHAWPCSGPLEARDLTKMVISGHPEIGFEIITRNPSVSRIGKIVSRVNIV